MTHVVINSCYKLFLNPYTIMQFVYILGGGNYGLAIYIEAQQCTESLISAYNYYPIYILICICIHLCMHACCSIWDV